jgi:hypothetical protein
LRLAAQNLVAHGFAFCGRALECGPVFVLDGAADVPIVQTVLGLLQEYLVIVIMPCFFCSSITGLVDWRRLVK